MLAKLLRWNDLMEVMALDQGVMQTGAVDYSGWGIMAMVGLTIYCFRFTVANDETNKR